MTEQAGIAEHCNTHRPACAAAAAVDDDPAGPVVVRVQARHARDRTHGRRRSPEADASLEIGGDSRTAEVECPVAERQAFRELRLQNAADEMSQAREFDFVIINELFERALFDLKAIVHAQRLKFSAQRRARAETFKALHIH